MKGPVSPVHYLLKAVVFHEQLVAISCAIGFA